MTRPKRGVSFGTAKFSASAHYFRDRFEHSCPVSCSDRMRPRAQTILDARDIEVLLSH